MSSSRFASLTASRTEAKLRTRALPNRTRACRSSSFLSHSKPCSRPRFKPSAWPFSRIRSAHVRGAVSSISSTSSSGSLLHFDEGHEGRGDSRGLRSWHSLRLNGTRQNPPAPQARCGAPERLTSMRTQQADLESTSAGGTVSGCTRNVLHERGPSVSQCCRLGDCWSGMAVQPAVDRRTGKTRRSRGPLDRSSLGRYGDVSLGPIPYRWHR